MKKKALIALSTTTALSAIAAEFKQEPPEKYWDVPGLLTEIPKYKKSPYPDSDAKGLQAVLIRGYKRRPGQKNINSSSPDPLSTRTRGDFFAYIGFPDSPAPKGGFPGIVLIHGGGGTAFARYTRRWIRKGYAVIALDWYNSRPTYKDAAQSKIKENVPLPGGKIQDHVANVANMILCHSLLRSLPNVNPDKTAFVGLSWGSWYGAMVASIDNRFQGGVEIYCGDVKRDKDAFKNETLRFTNGRFHHAIKIPLYWIVSTIDQNMTLSTINEAFKECPTLYNKTIVNDLPHSHIGFDFDACFRMASHFTRKQPSLPKLGKITQKGNVVSAKILDPGKGITYAVLNYTDTDKEVRYHERKWKSVPAEINGDTISATVPAKAHHYYLSAYEKDSKFHDLCGSTETIVIE